MSQNGSIFPELGFFELEVGPEKDWQCHGTDWQRSGTASAGGGLYLESNIEVILINVKPKKTYFTEIKLLESYQI